MLYLCPENIKLHAGVVKWGGLNDGSFEERNVVINLEQKKCLVFIGQY